METEARQQELLRRIEERVGPGGEDSNAAMNVLVAALAGLRAEFGGLRADVGSLRAELTNLRATMDSSVGRLSSELAVARAESADRNRRHDDLVGRLDGLADAVAQRVESRQSEDPQARAAEARLAAVEESLDGLGEGLEALARDSIGAVGDRVAALEGQVLSLADLTRGQQAGAQEKWAAVMRAALGDLASAIDGDLAALGASLTRLFTSAHDARIDEVTRLNETIARLDDANTATRALVQDEVVSLRGDLADALEEVRDRITASLAETSESIGGVVKDQRSSYDELVAGVQSAARASADTGERMNDVEQTVVALDAAVTALRADWSNRTHTVVSAAERAARAATDDFRRAGEAALADVHDALEGGTATVGEGVAAIAEATGRLVTAGQALLGYLAERDFILENERDRILHDIFDAFGEGLSAKERRWAAGRLAEALDRRRELRDAERWRRGREERAPIEVPTPPDDLLALAAPPSRPAPSRDGPPSPATRRRKPAGSATKPPHRPPVKAAATKSTSSKPATKRSASKKPAARKSAGGNDSPPRPASSANGTAAGATTAAGNGAAQSPDGLSAPVLTTVVMESPEKPEIVDSDEHTDAARAGTDGEAGRTYPEPPGETDDPLDSA